MTSTYITLKQNERNTILIVDDTPENLTILGEPLLPYYCVRIAISGSRALEISKSPPRPDLILLDVMMPEMDGYEVLTRLRADPDTRDIPIIFITALDSIDDETRGFELGAVDYISKPIRPSIVLARVRSQLELKQARDRMKDLNAWLKSEVDRHIMENQLIQDASMRALACLAETRDNETGNHILRTQGYVEVLCQEMSQLQKYQDILTPAYIATITKAAPLHDIGKVGIPDNVLHKPGKLTPDEWAIMQTHAELGAESIGRAIKGEKNRVVFDFLYVAMDIAHYHHEKWDGSGYPKGLREDAIPLSARVMALADVFDALITRRVYKPALSMEETTAILLEGKGKHFDPDVVEAFMARACDFAEIAERYSDTVE